MDSQASTPYVGDELELFREAHRWKAYLREQLGRYLDGDVLEVGAGLGTTTQVLCTGHARSWTCLEPDASMAPELELAVAELRDSTGAPPRVCVGTTAALPAEPSYDCVLYVDVLEHIREDRAELSTARAMLRRGGYLVVVSPAHGWLYSPFDRAIGHERRYDRPMLRALSPPGARLQTLRYLDCVGVLASLGNRVLMRRSMPTAAQIATWDRLMVPLSRHLDPLLGYRLGKSILAVWSC